MPDFLFLALLAGIAVALVAGPLGAFAVWRRMAYFGDTLAHSALLGVTFGLLLDINLNLAIALGCLLLALILVALQHNRFLATDTLLGILSHSTLALGLICVSVFSENRIDLMAYLFGDILSVNKTDVISIWVISLAVIAALIWLWRPLLAITVHEELAQVEGVAVTRVRTSLMLLMALVIAIAMKVVGVLLITALLIIPAAASRRCRCLIASDRCFVSQIAQTLARNATIITFGFHGYWPTSHLGTGAKVGGKISKDNASNDYFKYW
ncbi:MAG: znuB [Cellvibrio sp.]|nr:znuB [Cellvibrio sp.]